MHYDSSLRVHVLSAWFMTQSWEQWYFISQRSSYSEWEVSSGCICIPYASWKSSVFHFNMSDGSIQISSKSLSHTRVALMNSYTVDICTSPVVKELDKWFSVDASATTVLVSMSNMHHCSWSLVYTVTSVLHLYQGFFLFLLLLLV